MSDLWDLVKEVEMRWGPQGKDAPEELHRLIHRPRRPPIPRYSQSEIDDFIDATRDDGDK